MKKYIICLIIGFISVSSFAQEWYGNKVTTNYLTVGDSTASAIYSGTLVNDTYVTNAINEGATTLGRLDSLLFDTTVGSPIYQQGTIFWDTTNYTLAFHTGISNSTNQIGQESWTLVQNNSGSTIDNGSAVYVYDAGGEIARIRLAESDNGATAYKFIGLTTTDIAHGAMGFVTVFGDVRGVNTLGMTEGEEVYLSTTAGEWTQTKPNAHIIRIGFVKYAHATDGIITVHPDYETKLNFAVLKNDGSDGTYIDSTSIETDSIKIEDLFNGGYNTIADNGSGSLKLARSTGNDYILIGGDEGDGITVSSQGETEWEGSNLYLNLGTGKSAGVLYSGTTNPTNTTRTNYDGAWYSTYYGFGDGTTLHSGVTYTPSTGQYSMLYDSDSGNFVYAEIADFDTTVFDTLSSEYFYLKNKAHGFYAFEDSSEVIALTQNVWAHVTNATNNLFISVENNNGFSISGDTIYYNETGRAGLTPHIKFEWGASGTGTLNDDFEFRIYNIDNTAGIIRKDEVATTGAGNTVSCGTTSYDVNAAFGDRYILQVVNRTNSNDFTIVNASIYIEVSHY